jgi:hypothetical protein
LANPSFSPLKGFAELLKTKLDETEDYGAIIPSRYWGNP